MPKDNLGPYLTQGDPSHPGVKGEPYHAGPLGGVDRVDVPGTGTFPPHLQGVVNKAQPQGLSSTNHYGHPGITDNQDVVPGLSKMASPETLPRGSVPEDHLDKLKKIQPRVVGVNAPLEEDEDNGQEEKVGNEEDDDDSLTQNL